VSTWAQMAHETLELNANKHGATRRAALFAAVAISGRTAHVSSQSAAASITSCDGCAAADEEVRCEGCAEFVCGHNVCIDPDEDEDESFMCNGVSDRPPTQAIPRARAREIQRVLDGAARRLLEEEQRHPVTPTAGSDDSPVHGQPDQRPVLVPRQPVPIPGRVDDDRGPLAA
jgi:hypothetical protein